MSDDMKYSDDYDIGWEKWIDAYDQTLQDLAEDVEDFDESYFTLNRPETKEVSRIYECINSS